MGHLRLLAAGLLLSVPLVQGASCAAEQAPSGRAPTGGTSPAAAGPSARELPALRVRTVQSGLSIPWDVARLPGGDLVVTERDSRRLLLVPADGGGLRVLAAALPGMWASGETGLMSVVPDPGFATNRRLYTCQGATLPDGSHDVRVVAWRLDPAHTGARRVDVVLKDIMITSGRHGGCRLLFDRAGSLWVGTGDSAVSGNPRNLRSLNGKTLRLDAATGRPWPSNPYRDAASLKKRYVTSYGHRNVQGLAQRADGTMWSVEHGSYRDDEVNLLRPGGDYGWQPGPGYDESPPMTDFSLPGKQIGARWSSGDPTVATSGAAWVHGRAWGRLNGTLAVACLKASQLIFMKFDDAGTLLWTRTPEATTAFGRMRSVRNDGRALLVTTSNGGDDRVLRVLPG